MKVATDRKYTDTFRTNAVSQVREGRRRQAEVARSLDISVKTLANWVGKALTKGARAPIGVNGCPNPPLHGDKSKAARWN